MDNSILWLAHPNWCRALWGHRSTSGHCLTIFICRSRKTQPNFCNWNCIYRLSMYLWMNLLITTVNNNASLASDQKFDISFLSQKKNFSLWEFAFVKNAFIAAHRKASKGNISKNADINSKSCRQHGTHEAKRKLIEHCIVGGIGRERMKEKEMEKETTDKLNNDDSELFVPNRTKAQHAEYESNRSTLSKFYSINKKQTRIHPIHPPPPQSTTFARPTGKKSNKNSPNMEKSLANF